MNFYQSLFLTEEKKRKKGDWCQIVSSDFDMLGVHMSDEVILSMEIKSYKSYIKSIIKKAAFKELQAIQATRSKVKDIQYRQP